MIDEEVSRSSIAITVRASKLTARGLAYVLGAAARQIRKAQREGNAPHGKQSARKLMRHGGDTSGMELPGDTRLFDRVARRWGVDYAIRPVEKGKYLLLFKAKQADAITGCFQEYSRRVLNRGKDRRVPIREQFKRAQELVKRRPQRQREREKEVAADDR
ncbi:PcfB family protein [Intestinimonas butyriciproducens]|uniref:PcfB family protein n=1 Tax=Intestinimonas butyriciproducens TaxID=1297617 RepID=UPI001A9C1E1E|nr:PcfB family protein [Intestinimonas butyriciproducens]